MRLPWRSTLLASAVLAAGAAAAASAEAQAVKSADNQLWSEIDVSAQVAARLALTATVVDRQGDGLPNPTLWGGGLTGDLRLSPNWSIGAGAYEVQARSAVSGGRLNATLPLAYITADGSAGGFHVSDRNRIEDEVGLPGDPWRYRNRLMVERPLHIALPIRSIFVSDEVFYDFGQRRLSRNRAQVGVTLTPVGPAALQLYLMRQDDAFAHPSGLNILGLTLKVEID